MNMKSNWINETLFCTLVLPDFLHGKEKIIILEEDSRVATSVSGSVLGVCVNYLFKPTLHIALWEKKIHKHTHSCRSISWDSMVVWGMVSQPLTGKWRKQTWWRLAGTQVITHEEQCSCPLKPHHSKWMTLDHLGVLANISRTTQERMALVHRHGFESLNRAYYHFTRWKIKWTVLGLRTFKYILMRIPKEYKTNTNPHL